MIGQNIYRVGLEAWEITQISDIVNYDDHKVPYTTNTQFGCNKPNLPSVC